MFYFIHSPKQTSYSSGIDQYWKPNEHGYTSMLADAGIYTEEDKERISKRSNEWGATFLPITKELLLKAEEQIKQKKDYYIEQEHQEIKRHTENINILEKRLKENDLRMDSFLKMKEFVGINTEEGYENDIN